MSAIRKSQHPDHLISFIDGRKYKSLKRHLNAHDMTAAAYRERYGLPNDYPMVASGYSAQRREMARSLGLGRKPMAQPAEGKAAKGKGRSRAPAAKTEASS